MLIILMYSKYKVCWQLKTHRDYSTSSVFTRKVNSLKSSMYVRKKQMKLKAQTHSHEALATW